MKTYINNTWNWFRLLALGSILVCANSSRANAATTPTITWPALSPITYATPLTTAQLDAAARVGGQLVSGTYNYRVLGYGNVGLTTPAYLPVSASGWVLAVDFVPQDTVNYTTVSATNSTPLVVNVLSLNIVVNSKSRSFGEPNPVFDFTWFPQQPLDRDGIIPTASCAAVPSSPVGTYSIVGNVPNNGASSLNYSFNVTPGVLTITKATLTITPNLVQTSYGVSNAPTTTSASSFTATLPPSVTYREDLTNIAAVLNLYDAATNKITTAWPQSGTYYYRVDSVKSIVATYGNPVANNPFEATGNYNVVSNFNSVVVNPVQLTLTATNQAWMYGGFQQFTGSISGLVTTPEFDDSTNFAITWGSVSSNQAPGTYSVSPSITEQPWANGRLARNYPNYKLVSGQLVVIKRTQPINWNIAFADQNNLPYGTIIGPKQKNATYGGTLLDPAAFVQPLPITYLNDPRNSTEPFNFGTNYLIAVSAETPFYAENRVTNFVRIVQIYPTITWATEVTDSASPRVGHINDMAYGTKISGTQLAATAQGIAGGTPPGGLQYNTLSDIILPPQNDYLLSVSSAATQNYYNTNRTVKLNITNGVFDVASPAIGTVRASTGNTPVTFSFGGVAKVGDSTFSDASTKLSIDGTAYFTTAGGATLAPVSAVLVNTNADAAGTVPVSLSVGTGVGANGAFTLTGTITPSTFYPAAGGNLVIGTNFELQVSYPDAWIAGYPTKAVKGNTVKYVVTVGRLGTSITLNTDNSDVKNVYGTASVINFPILVKFDSGDVDLGGKSVTATFGPGSTNIAVGTLTKVTTGNYSSSFNLVISNNVADFRTNFVTYINYPVKVTLAGDASSGYNGSDKTINVIFTKRDLPIHALPGDAASVIYGENGDNTTANFAYSYKKFVNAIVGAETPTNGLILGDIATVPNNLPSIFTTVTGTNSPVTITSGQPTWNTGLASLNYNLVYNDGKLTIMRRQLVVNINDFNVQTNVDHASQLATDWSIDGWVDSGDVKSAVKAFNGGKIELATTRPTNAPVNSSFIITNKFGEVLGTIPDPKVTTDYTKAHILTNYSEVSFAGGYAAYPAASEFAKQYSFYVDGPLGTNYFVTTHKTYGILNVVGIMPTYVWNPTNMTYGDVFSTNNVLSAFVSTNGTLDTNPAHYKYYAFENDVDGGGMVQVYNDNTGTYRKPMATNALKIQLQYDGGIPSLLATLTVDKTVAVNKPTLTVLIGSVSASINSALPANWGFLPITYNGQLNSDPITGAAGSRAIFARLPAANSTFLSSVIETNPIPGNLLSPIGVYSIDGIISDTGFNTPSNYTLQFSPGTYTVIGATQSGGPVGWSDKPDNTFNIVTNYGWYYKQSTLTAFLTGLNPAPTDPSQFTVTINGKTNADGTLLGAQTNTILFKYQKDATYQPLYFTNQIQIRPYNVVAVIKWDSGLKAQTARAYRDDVNLFPTLWDNSGTNFALSSVTPIATAGPFGNFVTFDPATASKTITNGAGTVVRWLTNGAGVYTNLMFAVTNELMSDLGVHLTTTATPDVQVGVYTVGLAATSGSGKTNYTFTLDNGTSTYPGVPSISVTQAVLKLTINDASKAYGSPNPTFTGLAYPVKSDGVTPAPNADGITLSFSSSATTGSIVGTYPIQMSYDVPNGRIINYNPPTGLPVGTLTVTGAVLTATANDKALRTGQQKPATFTTKSITGFVNNETTNVIGTFPTWDTAYTPSAPTGATFPITNKVQGVALNYTFKYVNGTVIVQTNVPPVPHNDTVTVPAKSTGKILVSKLLANDYSPFGDDLSLYSFQSVSSNGIPVITDNTGFWLYYNPAPVVTLSNNMVDYFTYRVADSVGGLGTGLVQVKVQVVNTNYNPNNIISASADKNTGYLTLRYAGIDGRQYHVQGTEDLVNGPWTDLSLYDRNVYPTLSGAVRTSVFTCVNGAVIVTDPDAASNGSRFYRAITPQ